MVLPNRHKRIASAKARARKGLPPKTRSTDAPPVQDSETRPDTVVGDELLESDGSSGSGAEDDEDAEAAEEDLEAEAFERAQPRGR